MIRRLFLQSLAGATLAAQPAARIRIAFLGGSHSHAEAKVKVVMTSPDYELAGLWEEDSKAREGYERAGVRMLSRDQILDDKSIQVIAVESEVAEHGPHARAAVEAGKHVHIEKPPALDVGSFRSLLDLAEQKRLHVQVGYMWRHHPGINKALEAARRGWLGDVYLVRGTMNTLIPADRRPEWAKFRGGQMFEQGPHMIDPIVRLLGRPERVTSVLKKSGDYNDSLADNTVAVLEYGRALGIVMCSTLQPNAFRHRTFEILGTKGTAAVRPIEPAALEIDLAEAAGPYQARLQKVKLPPYERYVDDFKEMASAVRGEKPLSVSPRENLLVQETLIRASQM